MNKKIAIDSISEVDMTKIYAKFPAGDCYVLVRDDSFDDGIFEFFLPDEERNGWVEILDVRDTPADPYCFQGSVIFFNINTFQLFSTTDSSVKLADDVLLLRGENPSAVLLNSADIEEDDNCVPRLKAGA